MLIRQTAVTIATLLVLLSFPCNAATMRALLVGVSEYPDLPGHSLDGPRNDVARMQEILLQRRGFQANQITVLADGVKGAALPTRKAILDSLDALGNQAQKDDFVLLYFAGHGSLAPEFPKAGGGRVKPDGLSELFLPRDVAAWPQTSDGRPAHIPGSIRDTEIRDRVDRITARGAFVWGIFDACHSATMVRGAADGTEVRYRTVSPDALHIPASLMDQAVDAQAAKDAAATPAAPALEQDAMSAAQRNAGGSVFFYAAQTSQEAPELRLPFGHPERKSYGLFGYTIMQALDSGIPMSYRQLGQYVLSQYGAINIGRRPPTPLFSGTRLDTLVMGQDSLPVQQWKLNRAPALGIPAGLLSRVSVGTIFALVADPLADNSAALGYATASKVDMVETTLTLTAYQDKPVLAIKDLPASTYARILVSPPQYALSVALDTAECGAPCVARPVLDHIRQQGIEGAQLQWLNAPALADVAIKVQQGRVLLLPPSLQGLQCSARKKDAERSKCDEDLRRGAVTLNWLPAQGLAALESVLKQSLHSVARSTNLMRIAARREPGATQTSPLQVSLTLERAGSKALALPAERVADLKAGDTVQLAFTNTGDKALDVTLLYLDANYGVSVLYPDSGASNRLERKASTSLPVAINASTVGLERFLIIAVESTELGERADFSFLAQSPLANLQERAIRHGGATRGLESDDLLAFRDAGFADFRTRAATPMARAPSTRTSVQVFNVNILP